MRKIAHFVFDQNVNDNASSTPFRHEALDVDRKMVMLGTGLYHNTFSLICLKCQQYPEHDTPCLSIFLLHIFLYFPLSITPCLQCSLDRCFCNYLDRLTSLFCVK